MSQDPRRAKYFDQQLGAVSADAYSTIGPGRMGRILTGGQEQRACWVGRVGDLSGTGGGREGDRTAAEP